MKRNYGLVKKMVCTIAAATCVMSLPGVSVMAAESEQMYEADFYEDIIVMDDAEYEVEPEYMMDEYQMEEYDIDEAYGAEDNQAEGFQTYSEENQAIENETESVELVEILSSENYDDADETQVTIYEEDYDSIDCEEEEIEDEEMPEIIIQSDEISADMAASEPAFLLPSNKKFGVTVLGRYSWGAAHSTFLYNYFSKLKGKAEDLNCVMDVAAPNGTPLYAVLDGTVIQNGYIVASNGYGNGNYIIIGHDDGSYSFYCHMQSKSPCKVGSRVSKGQQIGNTGDSGAKNSFHVHFEWAGHDPYCEFASRGLLYTCSNSGASINPHKHATPAAKPATTQPAATQPAATKPATPQPAATQPATTKPATTQPAATKPAETKTETPANTQKVEKAVQTTKDFVEVVTADIADVIMVGKKAEEAEVVTKTSIKNASISGICTKAYTGEYITQNDVTVSCGAATLTEGVDYAVSYKNNKKIGVATMTFTGINGYKGSVKRTFKIVAYNIANDTEGKITVQDGIVAKLNKKNGSRPKPVVMCGDKVLKAGRDYTLSYKNNKKVYNGSNVSKLPTIIIKGKGNYKGTIKTYFVITK